MRGNRYRREVHHTTAGRYTWQIVDLVSDALVASGTGYSEHLAADADCRTHYAMLISGQRALFDTTDAAAEIAQQATLF